MRKLISVVLLLLVMGCTIKTELKWTPANFSDAQQISDGLKNVPKTDIETLYKQFSGIAECLKNCDNCFLTTMDLENTIQKFHDDYKYDARDKQEFNDVFVKYMNSKNIGTEEDTKDIVDNVIDQNTQISRSHLIDVMQTVADGARLALEKQDEPK